MHRANFAGLSWQLQIRMRRRVFTARFSDGLFGMFQSAQMSVYSLLELQRAHRGRRIRHQARAKAQQVCRPTGICMSLSRARTKPRKRPGSWVARWWKAPFDVGDRGRAALIQDPDGRFLFGVGSQASASALGVTGEPGAFCWADLNTPDPARAKTFYEGLFGWKLKPGEGKESGYLHIVNGENYIGGVPPARQGSGNAPPHWLIYFAVGRCG